MGLDRWAFRVIAYAALMTDRYLPLHADQGGAAPGCSPIDEIPGDRVTRP